MADITNLDYENDDILDENDDDQVIDSQQNVDDDDNHQEDEEDILETYLKSQGIEDIHKIKFEEDDGTEIEKDWNELSKDEQLNILNSNQTPPELGLDDEEIDLLNQIRASRMSPSQYIQSLIPQQQEVEPHYTVDDISDDELFMLDLQTRIQDITEEQLQNALTKAKEDEDLFKKQVAGMREEYKQLEDARNSQEEAIRQEQANQQYNQFADSIIDSIQGFTNIGELDITMDNDDMNKLASFILDRDQTGTSYFARALNDPNELVKMAWFALNGEEIFNEISDYYKRQIAQIQPKSQSKVAVRNKGNGKVKLENVKSVDSLLYS